MALRLLALLVAILAVSRVSGAHAQEVPSVADATSRATAAESCLGPLLRRLNTTLTLIRESKAQLRASDARAREDAASAIVSLEQRVVQIGDAIRACVPQSARLQPSTRETALTGVAARVGQANAATQIIEQDVPLVANVRVVVGERVDGSGSLPADLVRRAIRSVGAELQRCYGRMLDHGALEAGQAIVAFTVTPSGRVDRPSVEGVTFEDAPFRRCLRRAAGRIRVAAGAQGGGARFAYTLHFGP